MEYPVASMMEASENTTPTILAPTAPRASRHDFPAVTAAGSGIEITAQQKADFRRDGYLVVANLSTADELAALRVVYDRLFAERRGWSVGDMFDLVGFDEPSGPLNLPQMLWPSRHEPAFRNTLLHANAMNVARQLLGPKAENVFEHAILKPPLGGAATPWHQDDAFNRPGSGFVEQLSIWMPLQDVTVATGCMLYIRGSNHGPLFPHRSINNDPRTHGLETVSTPDLTNCVAVEMAAGSAVIHHSRTLHAAGINTTAEPRRAYALGFSVRSRRHQLMSSDHPWNLEKRTARQQRRLDSMPALQRMLRRLKRLLVLQRRR